ncbi:hypothetical protein [Marinirhabdus gelatinilytica]|uniref:Tellurite resistance protein TerB n=1 Tax=Marinirhabdus gelatinilytica TaxID=1703343 RepID=A0A370QFF3_9FLAO|nr:hypothetical protein [Marinirhabdus gelatinilytica]RDK87019.1 hypothetical protein C8D94_102197 [Marinirhabdus gelatinilytica]
MATKNNNWTKTELQTYILLLCANADNDETEEELKMIRSKVAKDTFEKMYEKFSKDTEEERLKKIDTNIHAHTYSNMELIDFRREVYEIFFSDCDFKMMEKRLDWTLDNILY